MSRSHYGTAGQIQIEMKQKWTVKGVEKDKIIDHLLILTLNSDDKIGNYFNATLPNIQQGITLSIIFRNVYHIFICLQFIMRIDGMENLFPTKKLILEWDLSLR